MKFSSSIFRRSQFRDSLNLSVMIENRFFALFESYIDFVVFDLSTSVKTFHISSSQFFSSQSFSNYFEQSYQQTSSRITQRRLRKFSLTYGQQTVEIIEKSRKFLTISQLRRSTENFIEQQKWTHILQKFENQKKVIDQIIDAQNAWNKNFKKQQNVWNEFLKTYVDMVTSQIDDFKNEFKNNLDALSQSTIHTQNRMNEFFVENRIVMNNLARLIQQQQSRFSRFASSKKKTSRIDKTYDFFAFRFFFVDSLILLDSKKKNEKFRESNIDYFNSTCFETYDKSDYVIISDKIHYRNVWLFIEVVKSIVVTKKDALIRINFHKCFRGDV